MNIEALIKAYHGSVFDVIPNEQIVNETESWQYYFSIKRNAIIGCGWMDNDDIFLLNGDGEHLFNTESKLMVYENIDSDGNYESCNSNNLIYHVKEKDELINFFGLRGGDGNHLTKDKTWHVEMITLSWCIKIPRLSNYKSGVRTI